MSDAAAKRRARQTLINLLLSLGATLGLVLLLILGVPRDDSVRIQPVDYQELAQEASSQAPGELLVPELPAGWYSNSARYRTISQDGVANWYVGFVGPKSEYLAMIQGFDVNQTWIQFQLGANKPTGSLEINGLVWEIHESVKENNPPKSKDYLLLHRYGSNVVMVFGVAADSQFREFASNLGTLIGEIQ